jgi:transcription elongation factor GreA
MKIVTKPSYEARQATYTKYEKRIQDTLKDKEEARSQGDLSENFGYVAAEEEAANLRKLQDELDFLNPSLQVIDPKSWAEDPEKPTHVQLGKKITLSMDNETETLLIGGAWDSNLDNPNIAPYTSPLSKAIIGKKPGEETVHPINKASIKILKIENPTLDYLETIYSPKKKEKKQENLEIPNMH